MRPKVFRRAEYAAKLALLQQIKALAPKTSMPSRPVASPHMVAM